MAHDRKREFAGNPWMGAPVLRKALCFAYPHPEKFAHISLFNQFSPGSDWDVLERAARYCGIFSKNNIGIEDEWLLFRALQT